MRLRAREKRGARVEMVPLIDTVFLLLVFFMYAMLTMTVHRGIKVELPKAGRPAPELHRHVTVSIDQTGEISVQGSLVSLDGLIPAVKEALLEAAQQKIVIDGDENANLGTGVRVLERLSHIPDIKVSFGVKEEK